MRSDLTNLRYSMKALIGEIDELANKAIAVKNLEDFGGLDPLRAPSCITVLHLVKALLLTAIGQLEQHGIGDEQ